MSALVVEALQDIVFFNDLGDGAGVRLVHNRIRRMRTVPLSQMRVTRTPVSRMRATLTPLSDDGAAGPGRGDSTFGVTSHACRGVIRPEVPDADARCYG